MRPDGRRRPNSPAPCGRAEPSRSWPPHSSDGSRSNITLRAHAVTLRAPVNAGDANGRRTPQTAKSDQDIRSISANRPTLCRKFVTHSGDLLPRMLHPARAVEPGEQHPISGHSARVPRAARRDAGPGQGATSPERANRCVATEPAAFDATAPVDVGTSGGGQVTKRPRNLEGGRFRSGKRPESGAEAGGALAQCRAGDSE
jgi:hypothetical protein